MLQLKKGKMWQSVDRTYPASKALTQGGETKRTTDRRYGSSSPHLPAKKKEEEKPLKKHQGDYSMKTNNSLRWLKRNTSKYFIHMIITIAFLTAGIQTINEHTCDQVGITDYKLHETFCAITFDWQLK